MDALRYDPDANTFSLVSNVPVPTVTNPTDVIVEVRSSGVCGTDLHIIAVKLVVPIWLLGTLTHAYCDHAGEIRPVAPDDDHPGP